LGHALVDAFERLNSAQRATVQAQSHLLVTACPGSGKTATLSVKAATILQDPSARVCIVTFTKDAADELKTRTVKLLDTEAQASRLVSGTFHSLCFRMLRSVRNLKLTGILGPGEQFQFARRLIAERALDIDEGALLARIECARTGVSLPGLNAAQENALASAYVRLMRANKKIDFTDLVVDTLAGLDDGSLKPMQITHLLVDEYQDTDICQYRWLAHHSRAGAVVTVVGDDDQSIFSFRQSLGYAGMIRFRDEHTAQQIVLGSNYRCRAEILDVAARLIVFNEKRVPKTLVAARGTGGSVSVEPCQSADDEALYVAELFADFAAGTYTAAVLSRTNASLTKISTEMTLLGIDHVAPKGASIFDSHIAAMFCDLISFAATGDTRGVEACLAFCGADETSLQAIHALLVKKGTKPHRPIADEAQALWDRFEKTFRKLHHYCAAENAALLIEGVRGWLTDHGEHGKLSKSAELIDIVANVFSRLKGAPMDRVKAFRDFAKRDAPNALTTRRIVLTTMHSSKGLEWDRVHIIRADAALCPGDGDIEEERRLFYVAMTRARDQLSISYLAKKSASTFLTESTLVRAAVASVSAYDAY
jgi:superfamily I DNA/RNA helicase